MEGGEIHEFDADNAVVRDWLGWPSARAAADVKASFVWLRPSPVSIDSMNQPAYTTNDEIGVVVTGDEPVDLVLRRGQTELASKLVSSVATLSIEAKGAYELVVGLKGQELEAFSFVIVDDKGDGFIEPDPEMPWHAVVSHIDTGETELTRKDLFNQRLNLDINCDRGIENLSAKLTVSPGDAAVTVRLDRIPMRLAANHPIWDELSKKLPTAVLKSPCDLSLCLEIEGLSRDTWLLEAELEELWWDDEEGVMPVAVSDNGPFEVRRYGVIDGTCIDEPTKGEPFISVALDEAGNELHFDARVCVVGDSVLHRQLVQPKRFLRQMDDINETPGLRSITQRYLQLSSASSSSLVAEVNRVGAAQEYRSWILHSVCGPNWIHKQREISRIESASPVKIWWEYQAMQENLLQPRPEEERSLPQVLPELLLAEFADVLPDFWWDGSVLELDEDDAIPLDPVFQRLLDDDSIIVDAEALTESLRQANERLCGGPLAYLLIPADAGDELLGWHVSEMNVTDCASQLYDWIRRKRPKNRKHPENRRLRLGSGRGRQVWTTDELQTWLNLLLYPERLRKQPWESVLEKLLQDRPIARAGAFVAWRMEDSVQPKQRWEGR